jgi:hypothetical protein
MNAAVEDPARLVLVLGVAEVGDRVGQQFADFGVLRQFLDDGVVRVLLQAVGVGGVVLPLQRLPGLALLLASVGGLEGLEALPAFALGGVQHLGLLGWGVEVEPLACGLVDAALDFHQEGGHVADQLAHRVFVDRRTGDAHVEQNTQDVFFQAPDVRQGAYLDLLLELLPEQPGVLGVHVRVVAHLGEGVGLDALADVLGVVVDLVVTPDEFLEALLLHVLVEQPLKDDGVRVLRGCNLAPVLRRGDEVEGRVVRDLDLVLSEEQGPEDVEYLAREHLLRRGVVDGRDGVELPGGLVLLPGGLAQQDVAVGVAEGDGHSEAVGGQAHPVGDVLRRDVAVGAERLDVEGEGRALHEALDHGMKSVRGEDDGVSDGHVALLVVGKLRGRPRRLDARTSPMGLISR